jgi:hypothetical protein
VGWANQYHGYVVTTDLNGSQQYFRGGPGRPTLNGVFGNIGVDYGAYRSGTKDWSAEKRPSMTLYEDDKSCDCENTRFAEILRSIQDLKALYQPASQNSNSVVGTMLRRYGLKIGPLPVAAPAFNTNLNENSRRDLDAGSH